MSQLKCQQFNISDIIIQLEISWSDRHYYPGQSMEPAVLFFFFMKEQLYSLQQLVKVYVSVAGGIILIINSSDKKNALGFRLFIFLPFL